MLATLTLIREKYGNAEGYIKARTSLSDADIAQIRRNLLPLPIPPDSSTEMRRQRGGGSAGIQRAGEMMAPNFSSGLLAGLYGCFAYVYQLFWWIWRGVLWVR